MSLNVPKASEYAPLTNEKKLGVKRDLDAYLEAPLQANIKGFVKTGSMGMNRYGDWEFTVVMPRDVPQDAENLAKLVGMPVNITIGKWKRRD